IRGISTGPGLLSRAGRNRAGQQQTNDDHRRPAHERPLGHIGQPPRSWRKRTEVVYPVRSRKTTSVARRSARGNANQDWQVRTKRARPGRRATTGIRQGGRPTATLVRKRPAVGRPPWLPNDQKATAAGNYETRH